MFDIDILETTGLGNRSYLASDGQVAIAIDPPRDIDRVLALAGSRGVRIALVLSTHSHNDMISGETELARLTGAQLASPADDGAQYRRDAVTDGDVLTAGRMHLRVLHTPGHTHHHVAYALQASDGDTQAVFTGGSLLFGATGRTDLVGPEHTDTLTRAQFHSVRRLVAELPADTAVYPTHGFGSFCAATPTSGEDSTLGEQQQVNPALTLDEQTYVDTLLAGLDAYPAYYKQMSPVNRRGPAPVDLTAPEPVDGDEVRRRIDAGAWVVDLRDRTAFAAGHIAGTLGFELSTSFVTYLGWTIPWGTPLTLIGESAEQVADAQRELVRIGIDRLAGAATGPVEQLTDSPLSSYDVIDFGGLRDAQQRGSVRVLDTRRHDERRDAAIPGSQHIPLHELADRLDELPDTTLFIHCGSGYRASIAASMLDALGKQVVLVDDSFDNARTAGLIDSSVAA
ncbi:MAG: MBL fold metallo-hydrolase [Actinomycetes bacterium]